MRSCTVPRAIELMVLLLCMGFFGCSNDTSVTTPEKGSSGKGRGDLPSVASTDYFAFTAGWDTWWQNISGSSSGLCTSDTTVWAKFPDCNYLRIARYDNENGNLVSRAYMAIDFDTSSLPDNAIPTATKLGLYVLDRTAEYWATEPPPLDCWAGDADGESGNVGLYWGPVPSLGYKGDQVWWVPTDICSSQDSAYVAGQPNQNMPSPTPPSWVELPLPVATWVSTTAVSRYGIDSESVLPYMFYVFTFRSANSAYNKPTLKITGYKMPFEVCLDGEAAHKNQNCSSCADADFDFNTANPSATIKADSTQTACGKKQAVFVFDTADLVDGHTLSSATLRFAVKSTLGRDVSTQQVRIYSKQLTGSCPTTLTNADFIGCGSGYTDLGLVDVGEIGTKTLTIPNADTNLNKTGPTKFVVVDASVYDSGTGDQTTVVKTNEDGTAASRPKLEVVYN